MKIVNAELKAGQYFRAVYPKKNIVLHHTVSSTARSALTWWGMTADRVGTAFVIDKDGTIYQAFAPEYWAHHLGLKHFRNTDLNRQSIGIELVNEGPLLKQESGYRWNFSAVNKPGSPYKGEAVNALWRGFEWWAAYTPQQYEALNELIPYLLNKFKLPATMLKSLDFDMTTPDRYTIYQHCNVRRDKSDISPAFDFSKINIQIPV